MHIDELLFQGIRPVYAILAGLDVDVAFCVLKQSVLPKYLFVVSGQDKKSSDRFKEQLLDRWKKWQSNPSNFSEFDQENRKGKADHSNSKQIVSNFNEENSSTHTLPLPVIVLRSQIATTPHLIVKTVLDYIEDKYVSLNEKGDIKTKLSKTEISSFTTSYTSSLIKKKSATQKGATYELPYWIWYLSAHTKLKENCLEELLNVASIGGKIACVSPLIYTDSNYKLISQVGIKSTRSSRELDHYEQIELDQEQYHRLQDVMAAPLAGQLIRYDIFTQVFGFTPELKDSAVALNFGRKIRLIGYRSVIAPKAKLSLSIDGQGSDLGKASFEQNSLFEPSLQDRIYGEQYNYLVYGRWLPFSVLRLVLFNFFYLLISFIHRDFALTKCYLSTYSYTFRILGKVREEKKSLRQIAKLTPRKLSRYEVSMMDYWEIRQSNTARNKFNHRLLQVDEKAVLAWQSYRFRNWFCLGFIILVAVLLTLYTFYPFSLSLSSSSWYNLPQKWSSLAASAWSNWVASANGYEGLVNPLLRPLSLLSLPFVLLGLSPSEFLVYFYYASILITAFTCWFFLTTLTRRIIPRLIGVLVYLSSPLFLLGVVSANLNVLIVLEALPLLTASLIRSFFPCNLLTLRTDKLICLTFFHDRINNAALCGFSLLFLGAIVPLSFTIVLVLVIVFLLAKKKNNQNSQNRGLSTPRSQGSQSILVTFLILVPSVICHFPLYYQAIKELTLGNISLWFYPVRQQSVLELRQVYLEFSPIVWTICLLGLLGLVLALVTYFILNYVKFYSQKSLFFIILSSFFLFFSIFFYIKFDLYYCLIFIGLFYLAGISALITYRDLPYQYQDKRGKGTRLASNARPMGVLVSVVLVVALLSCLLLNLSLPRLAENNTLETDDFFFDLDTASIPLSVASAQQSTRKSRLLVLNNSQGVIEASIYREGSAQLVDLSLGEAELGATGTTATLEPDDAQANQELANLVAELSVSVTLDITWQLAYYNIDSIIVSYDYENFEEIERVLDAGAGLEKIGSQSLGMMWRVRPDGYTPSRVYLVTDSGSVYNLEANYLGVDTKIEIPESGTIVIAESSSRTWKASFNGISLTSVESPTGDWQQAFSVDQGEGVLTITNVTFLDKLWITLSVVSFLLMLICLVPPYLNRSRLTKVEEEH